jgi:hypothetical protein
MRHLLGRWNAMPFGETLELTFPPSSPWRGTTDALRRRAAGA